MRPPFLWPEMKMDPTTVQTLVIVASYLVIATAYIVASRSSGKIVAMRLEMIDGTMEDFKKEISKLADVLIAQAIQGKRMDNMEERIMSQGKRLDETEKRLNLYADAPIYQRRDKD